MSICPACKSTLSHVHSIEDPVWINDPIKTPLGLSGLLYRGSMAISYAMIVQLQAYYNNLMIDTALTPPTWITSEESKGRAQIEQLRICVELLLDASGLTIADYFKSDKYGTDWVGGIQVDWTDVDRSIDGAPRLPKPCTSRAIHIEELRRGLITGLVLWRETWEQIPPNPLVSDSGSYTYPFVSGGGIGGGGHYWAGGRLYALNNWYRDCQCWYGNGAGVMTGGGCSFSFNQTGTQVVLSAQTNISATVSLGSLNYVMSVYNHLTQLSDELLIQATNRMKLKLVNTLVSGSNYYGILELDATIGFTGGGVASKTIVLASISGRQCHAEAEPWAYIDSYGYLVWDPADGGAPWYRLQHWQNLISGVFKLVDILELEYGYDPATISYIRIYGVRLHSSCSGYASRNCSVPPICVLGDTIAGSGSISLQLGNIKLIS